MTKPVKVREVFKSLGQPTATYVERKNGLFEKSLSSALDINGRLCLLTGPSKTGKTTLYTKVVEDLGLVPLVIRCDATVGPTEFWKRALEKIDFQRVYQKHAAKGHVVGAEGKLGGTVGWAWLAKIIGEVKLGVERTKEETEIREKILAKASPDHLVPVLQKLPLILVVEDFHYLRNAVKTSISQQWKVFTDNEVSVVVVGTTHHAVDLAYANKDLVGRIAQIDLSTWDIEDLKIIVRKGFEYLDMSIGNVVVSALAKESAGLPIVTQDACYQLFADKEIKSIEIGKCDMSFSRRDAYEALHNVAVNNYAQFESIYKRLTTGPRKKARKYDTYELVLSTFAQDPITFALDRYEISKRLEAIPLSTEKLPPPASINSMLKALEQFQKRSGIELLEWMDKEQCLFILEPSFLFYLRWREKRDAPPSPQEIIKRFLSRRRQIAFKRGRSRR